MAGWLAKWVDGWEMDRWVCEWWLNHDTGNQIHILVYRVAWLRSTQVTDPASTSFVCMYVGKHG